MQKNSKYILCLLGCLILSSCDQGFKQKLGLQKMAPDEFQVVSHPSLVVPPEFGLLPPGGAHGKSVAHKETHTVIADYTSKMGTVEREILSRMDSSAAMPEIRNILLQEGG